MDTHRVTIFRALACPRIFMTTMNKTSSNNRYAKTQANILTYLLLCTQMYPEGEQTFGGRCVRQVWSNATRRCGQSTGPDTLACIPIFLAPLALYLTYWSPYRCAICTPYSRSLLFVATATRLAARLKLLATANARTRWARTPLTLSHLDHPHHNEENSNQRC